VAISEESFSREITIEVMRRAMRPSGEFFTLYEHSLAVLGHVRRLAIVGRRTSWCKRLMQALLVAFEGHLQLVFDFY
jgi:hypothetical protein